MDWERLISDYLDDALSPQEAAELFQWIHSHPDNARRFANAAFVHRCLEHRLSAMRLLQENAAATTLDDQRPSTSDAMPVPPAAAASEKAETSPAHEVRPAASRLPLTSRRFRGIAAAILLIVGVVAVLAWPRGSPARLSGAENATWGAGIAPPQPGERLPKGALVLTSGLINLSFENGNQILIEGPARFSITDERSITLDQGSLTAIVTQAGRGLSVSTSTARVTDLGTEFGVQASATLTRIVVFNGKVSVDRHAAGSTPRELSAGSAVDVSTAGISSVPFDPVAFKRVTPVDSPPLDLVDLLAGGDGTGSASGVGIDAATGRTRETKAVTTRRGNQQYLPIKDHSVLDGCFIPGGRMPVDSAGHLFTFPTTSLFGYGLIWTGPNIPWEGELPISTTLPQAGGAPTSRVLVMHSNNGVTFNLDAIRALHAQLKITGFRAVVGNSYRAAPGSNPSRPLASIHVIVDGIARYEKRAFANVDAPIDVACRISDNDHFLTLATTDGGDGNSCDWILWTHPEVLVRNVGR